MAISLGSMVAFIGANNADLLRGASQSALAVEKMSKSISTSLLATGKTISNFGKIMTIGLTLPIAAAGAGIIKLASDAEETSAKFGTVFRNVSSEANAMANDLRTSFGLSRLESQKLLSDTGDLLTGFGFTGESALDLSGKVNKLAVDLASFTNIQGGSARASAALTKALLGERESVKELGISILESDVKNKVAQLSAQGLTFATNRQAKAYATLLIATEQSKNAIGDFARTQQGVANQARIFRARLSDVAVQMGSFLLPMVNKLLGKMIELANKFSALDNQTKANIIAFAALAASIGPITFLVGTLISLSGVLVAGFGAVAGVIGFILSPIGLLAVAFVGIVALLMKTQNAAQILGKAWITLRTSLALALSGIGKVLKGVSSLVANFLRGIQVIARVAGIEMPQGMNKAISAIDGFSTKMDEFSDTQGQTALDVSSNWGTAWDQFRGDMQGALEFAETFAGDKAMKLKTILSGLTESLNIALPTQAGGLQEGDVLGTGDESIIPDGVGDESEQIALDNSLSAWDEWLTKQRDFASVWDNTWSQTAVNVADGMAQGFADMIVAGKSFKSVISGLMRSVASDLIAQVVRSAIARLAVDQTVTVGNAAAAAPHPFLIPLFVGIGLAAFASAIGGTEGSSKTGTPGGGGGGGAVATAGTGSESLRSSSVIGAQSDKSEEGEGAVGADSMQTVSVSIDGEAIVKAVVRSTRNGLGDGAETLALAEG